MTKTYTLTEEELETIIQERLAHKPITPQGLFKEVAFDSYDLLETNLKYPQVVERLRHDWVHSLPDPARHIYADMPGWHKLSMQEVHNQVRSLVLAVFGKSKNNDLKAEEYEMAQALYSELKAWYIKAYDRRLEEFNN